MFFCGMGRLLDKLIQGTPACDVMPEIDGFTLVGKPGRLDEFGDLVREAADHAGADFVIFPVIEGGRYSAMLVVPLTDGLRSR